MRGQERKSEQVLWVKESRGGRQPGLPVWGGRCDLLEVHPSSVLKYVLFPVLDVHSVEVLAGHQGRKGMKPKVESMLLRF